MMLREKIFDGKSHVSRFIFKSMLSGLESPFRKRVNNPEKLVKASGIQAGKTVLEVGCGSGFFTASASEAVGEKGCVQAIDMHPVSVEETTKKIQTHHLTNVNISQADAHSTDFADASFDLILLYVMCNFILQRIPL
jgi:demethylmenaquinone methyltransferase/2-methoxy-6-polyprenyl-1,4-benzoquinol methylase